MTTDSKVLHRAQDALQRRQVLRFLGCYWHVQSVEINTFPRNGMIYLVETAPVTPSQKASVLV